MTEAEWDALDQPEALLEWVVEQNLAELSDRQIHSFALFCCERIMPVAYPLSYLRALQQLERHVDGEWSEDAISRVIDELTHVPDALDRITTLANALRLPMFDRETAGISLQHLMLNLLLFRGPEESPHVCSAIRDIFGNLIRPVQMQPHWLTSTVLDLARLIDTQRQFDRMPLLADALMDAGCDSEEVIKHCCREGMHARGCWVFDLLFSKE